MSIVHYFFDPQVCTRFAFTLMHFLWEGLAIAIIGLTIGSILSKKSPKVRYGVYLTSLIAMAVSLAITYSLLDFPPQQVSRIYQNEIIPGSLDSSVIVSKAGLPETYSSSHMSLDEIPSAVKSIEVKKTSIFSLDMQRCAPYLLSLYFLGVIVMQVRLILGLHGGQRLSQDSTPVEDSAILTSLKKQAQQIGLVCIPTIAYCRRIVVPTVVGVFRPTILLPFSFASGLSPKQVEMLLAHELAHIKNCDLFVNIIQRGIEAVLFFHPAVWLISHKIRIERENYCDDMVLKAGGKRTEYASFLVDIAQHAFTAASKRCLAAEGISAAGQPSQIGNRVRRLMGNQKNRQVRLKHIWVFIVLFCLILPGTIVLSGQGPVESKHIKKNVLDGLVIPKVNTEGQEILKKVAQVNQYWLLSPVKQVKNYSYDFNLYNRGHDEPTHEKIKVRRPTRVNTNWRHGITYDSILRKLIADPSEAIIRKIERDQNIMRLDFIFRDFTEVTYGNGISRNWRGYVTGLAKAGSLWLDETNMVPLKVKAGSFTEYFSDYIVVSEGRYVPLKILARYNGEKFDWRFSYYNPGLWIFDKACFQKEKEGKTLIIASINNIKINKKDATETKRVAVETPEPKEDQEIKNHKASRQRSIVTVKVNQQDLSFEGKTITWNQFPSLLANVPEPENTGLELIYNVSGLSSKMRKDIKTRLSILSRELGFRYLTFISNISKLEKPQKEYFFAAPLEFKKTVYIRQSAEGEFKQKHYRSSEGWKVEETGKHKELATLYVNSIRFKKTRFKGSVSATLKVAFVSLPKAKWKVNIELFDDKGNSLAKDSLPIEAQGSIRSGMMLRRSSELEFSFGEPINTSKAVSFEITVTPVRDIDAGLVPSRAKPGRENDGTD